MNTVFTGITREHLQEQVDLITQAINAIEDSNENNCYELFFEYRNKLRQSVVGQALSNSNSTFSEDKFKAKYPLDNFSEQKNEIVELLVIAHNYFIEQLREHAPHLYNSMFKAVRMN